MREKDGMVSRPLDEPGPPPVEAAWAVLADGLQIQRVHLHMAEWLGLVEADAPVPGIVGEPRAAAFTALPDWLDAARTDAARQLVTAAGLDYWIDVPLRHAGPARTAEPWYEPAADLAKLWAGLADDALADALRLVCGAAGWWIGFHAVIRHLGVDDVTLEDVEGQVALSVLEEAVGAVALGMALRLLLAHLPAAHGDEARRLYCRLLVASVRAEPRMTRLLTGLGELRLVELVGLSAPWWGQFTKYRGGAGAGQVE